MFAISSSRVVTPAGEIGAAIIVDGEKIDSVVSLDSIPSGLQVTDFGELVISPGIVDAHVHLNEPGRTGWEGFVSGTQAAAAGGVTSLIDMPLNSSPVTTNSGAWQMKFAAACGKLHVDVGFHGGLVPGNGDDVPSLVEKGVCGLKAFLCDSGLDEFRAVGETDLRAVALMLKQSETVLLAHAELTDATNVEEVTNPLSYQQYLASRPPEFETAAIALLIKYCREFQTPVHIVHLATAAALPIIEAAKSEGLPLTVETCPHYLFFAAEGIADGVTEFKCAPPIRDEKNRRELCDAVQSGLIDTIGSDHSPCPPDLKLLQKGDFMKAWGGISGLQLSLSACWTIGQARGWTPSLLAKRMSEVPARIFGLGNRKGKIEIGMDADFVIWDPSKSFEVVPEQLFHRHKVTPYADEQLSGVVVQTFVRGQTVFGNGVVSGEPSGTVLIRGEEVSYQISEYLNSLVKNSQIKNSQVKNSFVEDEEDSTVSLQPLCDALEKCCASQAWISRMVAVAGFENDADVLKRAGIAWCGLDEADYLEAFSAHPRIGDVNTLRAKYANTLEIAGGEQSGVNSANESVLKRLADANDEYFEKFGFIFIVCATGKSAAEMLKILESRLPNDRSAEIENAAAEQLKITRIRLRKLVG